MAQVADDLKDIKKAGQVPASSKDVRPKADKVLMSPAVIPPRVSTQTLEQVWWNKTPVWSVDFLPNGDIVTTSNKRLLLYDQAGHSRHAPLDEAGLWDVRRVAVHTESNTLAVIPSSWSGKSFTVIRTGGSSWSYISHDVDFYSNDVAFTPRGQLIITGGMRLVKYTTGGELVWEKDLGYGGLYVTVAGNDHIIVTDDSGRLNVFSGDGDQLYQIPREMDKDQLVLARGACTDSMNNMYVVDIKRGAVVMFDEAGRYIRNVITGLGVPARYRADVSLYEDRLLVIGSRGGYLALYKSCD